MRLAIGIDGGAGIDSGTVLPGPSACAAPFGDGVWLRGAGSAAADFSSPLPRVTPAAAAHRLTQLWGTWCFLAAAFTPLLRTSPRTVSRSSVV